MNSAELANYDEPRSIDVTDHSMYFHSTFIVIVHVLELKRVAGFISACHHLLIRCMANPYYRI